MTLTTDTEEDIITERELLFNPEDFIFSQLVRPGLGQICDYCKIKSGYSVSFTSFRKYLEHVLYNHEGYSVYAPAEELDRFKKDLPMANDYQKKLKQKMKEQLAKAVTYNLRHERKQERLRHEEQMKREGLKKKIAI